MSLLYLYCKDFSVPSAFSSSSLAKWFLQQMGNCTLLALHSSVQLFFVAINVQLFTLVLLYIAVAIV